MEDFDKWDFEIFKYDELLEKSSQLQQPTIIHFGFKLFLNYGLLEKFSIADGNFKSLLS
jgi:hypothetical protein